MAELHPYPFPALIRRMLAELETRREIFDLPERKFFLGSPSHDLSVTLHGHTASSPLGPAAGPQTQMAQNIVLSWLAGCRIMELKTVQIMDELAIPRPCIDMQTIGYNVEWSQELKLEQSLDEYVKGAMLIEILRATGAVDVAPGFERVIYDMSVGYDLAGIQSERVQAFIDGMRDPRAVVERLRAQIPDDLAQLRDLDYPTTLSDTLTLSTFHGCPPDEIERIVDFLLRDKGLHSIIKLNPTLLGPDTVRALLHDALGYTEVTVPDSAFEKDTRWHQVEGFVERLAVTAGERDLGLGVKFTNTLVCNNHRDFFPAEEKEMYLSGPPLHVLAMKLVGRFRERYADRFPISFSAGIDRKNFADAVALGLTPITVCSDLLQPGGYARAEGYFRDLLKRMDQVGARDVPTFTLLAYGHAEAALDATPLDDAARARCRAALAQGPSPTLSADLREAAGEGFDAWVSAARLRNTATYTGALEEDARYSKAKNSKPPRKLGSTLWFFECVTCDKCIPVCPNDANFALKIPPGEIPVVKAAPIAGGGFEVREEGATTLTQKHQIGNFADFCNECGNCDIFCPEDGGPYILKPRFFGTLAQWRELPSHDGFFLEREGERHRVWARFDGREVEVELEGAVARYRGEGFEVSFALEEPGGILGRAEAEVDLTYAYITDAVVRAIHAEGPVNYVAAL